MLSVPYHSIIAKNLRNILINRSCGNKTQFDKNLSNYQKRFPKADNIITYLYVSVNGYFTGKFLKKR